MTRLLLIGGDPSARRLVEAALQEVFGSNFRLDCVVDWAEGLRALVEKAYDACLVDYELDAGGALGLIRQAVAQGCMTPIIVLTGEDSRELDLEAMRAGAADFLPKTSLSAKVLEHKIRYAVQSNREKGLRNWQEKSEGPDILLIEDDEDDFLLIKDYLEEAHGAACKLNWAKTWDEGLAAMKAGNHDICLLDYRLGKKTGIELIHAVLESGLKAPVILLTGEDSRERDIEAMNAGAADYLVKGQITAELLDRSIRYAIQRYRAERSRAEEALVEGPRIALIEDDEDDYFLAKDLLTEIYGTTFKLDWIKSWDPAMEAVHVDSHDVYLVDYRLGEHNGLDLVREATSKGCSVPMILLTGESSREIDLEAMKAGAADYLVKGEITAPLLDRAIRYAVERKRAERRLVEMAQIDQLTGLANRFLFKEFLASALSRAERQQRVVAVMFLDLDRFKVINDTYGHDAGDHLIKGVAERLKKCVRASDLVARLGGDEFTVVLEGITDSDLIGHFGQRILDAIRQPFIIGENEIFTSASIGISVYPIDVDNLEGLIKSADSAMYRAKELGADNYQFYTMEMHLKAERRLELERGLRYALDRNEFQLHYQPQVDLRSGEVIGFEALIRWLHPQWGMVRPDQFIYLAEETGLVVAMGEWAIHAACAKIRELTDAGLSNFRVAVNFSARQFQEPDLTETVIGILEKYGVSARNFEVEITESSILTEPERVKDVLARFEEVGIRVALDDFGTGYSSLNHLKNFPVSMIKIDKSFVNNVTSNANDATIVKAIIGMAHNLGLAVIAEGVETAEQLALLREYGCDMIQGYYYSKPVSSEQVTPALFERTLDSVESERAPALYATV